MPRRSNQDDFDAQDAANLFNSFQRLDPTMKMVVVALLVIAGIVLLVAYERSRHAQQSAGATPPGYVHMLLGNPSGATDSPGNRNNYLMAKPYFGLSYNDSRGTPSWVSWRVADEDLGGAPRDKEFDPDLTLPAGFVQIVTHDYSGSGFDRGHMCPHSDRAANQEMSFATFVMTNIIPQAPNVNRKAWEQLESYGRELVSREHDHLYIIAGPAGQGGRGSHGFKRELAGGKVIVPAECWKVIVVVPETGGADDLAKINTDTRVITVIMPNDQDVVGEEWAGFRTSPADVEGKTGLHFFDRLRPEIASSLRQKVDRISIPAPRIHREAAFVPVRDMMVSQN